MVLQLEEVVLHQVRQMEHKVEEDLQVTVMDMKKLEEVQVIQVD